MDVVLSITDNHELEAVMTIDRVVNIDSNNMVAIADMQFKINPEWIERKI